MQPYFDEDGITIYHGDCRDVLPSLNAVDAVITDPPYGVGIDSWDGATPHDLLPPLLAVTTGPVLWFGAAPQIAVDIPAFDPRPMRVLVWAPAFTLSHTIKSSLAYRFQPIYGWQLPDTHGGPRWDVLTTSTEGGNWWKHACTKPVLLMRSLVGFCRDGGTVLDPFMGSGTTLRAAKDLGRRAIGIEIEERYCEIAVKRLQQQAMPLTVSQAQPPAEQPAFDFAAS